MFRLTTLLRRPSAPAQELPLEPDQRRSRLRRGGPRTPIPLLPIIAVAAGIGVAYVSQSAHATKATYQVTRLQAQQQQLVNKDQQLGDDLARLQSSARIVAAAGHLGMHPATHWAYVSTKKVPAWTESAAVPTQLKPDGGALEQLIAALRGVAGDAGP